MILGFSIMSQAQDYILPLWKDSIPNQRITSEQERSARTDILRLENVQKPTLTCFFPSDSMNTRKAVIICPGGGYRSLSFEMEGTDVAQWLKDKGINVFVLKYRLPTSKSLIIPHKAPIQDLQRAIRLVRSKAEAWNISENNIGVMGFSAGGHLASTLGVHYNTETYSHRDVLDSLHARPNFMALIYPVINMDAQFAHKGSVNNLLGQELSEALLKYYSNEKHIDALTPPTFLVHATDDQGVSVENSLKAYKNLKKANVPVEMHIFKEGGHGFGMALKDKHLSSWLDLLYQWIIGL